MDWQRFKQKWLLIPMNVTAFILIIFTVAGTSMVEQFFMNQHIERMSRHAAEVETLAANYYVSLDLIEDQLYENWDQGAASHAELLKHVADQALAQGGQTPDLLTILRSMREDTGLMTAVYSKTKGMLLYPYDDVRMSARFFNDEYAATLNAAWEEGAVSTIIQVGAQGEEMSYYVYVFAYEPMDWLILLLEPAELEASTYVVSDRMGFAQALQQFEHQRTSLKIRVLDTYYFQEYSSNASEIGSKITGVDRNTQKELSDLLKDQTEGVMSYRLLGDDLKDQRFIAYLHPVEQTGQTVMIEMNRAEIIQSSAPIVWGMRLLAAFLFIMMTMICYVLYENFIVYVDPLSEQEVPNENA